MMYLITGGERSGKSGFAEKIAKEKLDQPMYVATARQWDADFKNRIDRHQKDRDERWENIEKEKFLSEINFENRVAVIDCVTLWLTNFFVEQQQRHRFVFGTSQKRNRYPLTATQYHHHHRFERNRDGFTRRYTHRSQIHRVARLDQSIHRPKSRYRSFYGSWNPNGNQRRSLK